MKNIHYFTLVVETQLTKKESKLAALIAFAGRRPDGCSFKLYPDKLGQAIQKQQLDQGRRIGTEKAYNLIDAVIEKLKRDLKKQF